MTESMIIELIKAVGLMFAAGVPSLAAWLIHRSRLNKENLKSDLKKALGDLQFMLAVEAEHGRLWRESTERTQVRTVRNTVHARDHLDWSGAFSSKRILRKLRHLDNE